MKALIAYYSWGGSTRRIAELIQKETGGDLFEIEPVTAYTENYNNVVKQAKKEIQEGYLPELKTIPNIENYDTLFVGTPNWWSTMAPPAAAFLTRVDLAGKTVVPFCTHGGGGLASCGRDIAKLSAGAEVLESLALYDGRGTAADVSAWLGKLKGVKNG